VEPERLCGLKTSLQPSENIPRLFPTSYPADLRSVSSLCHTLTACVPALPLVSEPAEGAVAWESWEHPAKNTRTIIMPATTALILMNILSPFTMVLRGQTLRVWSF
jgi:hypothetical protein